MKDALKVGAIIVVGLCILPGCASAKVKAAQDAMIKDLNMIVQVQDCPTVCDALKAYIAAKLGVPPAIPQTPPSTVSQ